MSFRRILPWLSCSLLFTGGACEPTASRQSSPTAQPANEAPPATTEHTNTAPATASAPAQAVADETPPTSAELSADVHHANAFGFKMLARAKKPTDNAMISGTSLRLALATTYVGARGTTAREMASALSLDEDAKVTARLLHAERGAWDEARGNAELAIASRLWLDDDFNVLPDFTKIAETAFGAAPARIDYAKADAARQTINAWVSENTKNKIPDLLPQGSVDPQTRLVVTNAIWFKGRWEFPFSKSATKDDRFKIGGGKTVTAPLMHTTDSFRLAELPGLKVLELRYAESKLSMLVALPDESASLAKLQDGLDDTTLEKWNAALKGGRVNVTLPKFTFRYGGSVAGSLRDLGMRLPFTDKADFSGIAEPHGTDRLFIGDVFHQTWIAVDELGTEAAAATGVTMRTTSLITGPIADFRADHPFLFVIQDTKQQRALFVGRVANPTAQ